MVGPCTNCESNAIDVDETRGTATCTVCGTVLEDNIIVSEMTFTDGHGPVERFVDNNGRMGSSLPGAGRDSRTMTISNGENLIMQMAGKLEIVSAHAEQAVQYFKQAVEHRFTQGRITEHVVASCLYIVCRYEKTSHMLLDFADVLEVNVYKLASCFLKFCRKINITLPIVDPVVFIPRFTHGLNFGDSRQDVGKTALRLVSRMKRDWIHIGRRPAGVCGAALLLAARLHGFKRSPEEVGGAVRVGLSTLRQRLIEFGDTPSGNLTLEEFQTLELEGEQDPPAFKRALAKQKEIDDKMVSEGNAIAGSGVFQELDSEEQADTNPLALPYHGDAMPQSSLPGTGLTQTNLMPHPLLEQAHAPINVTSDVQTWHQPNPNDSLSDDEDEEVSNFILSEKERDAKSRIWHEENKEYLDKQAKKKLEQSRQPKRRKRKKAASTANAFVAHQSHPVDEEPQEKQRSSKINYTALEGMLGDDDDGQPQAQIPVPQQVIVPSAPIISAFPEPEPKRHTPPAMHFLDTEPDIMRPVVPRTTTHDDVHDDVNADLRRHFANDDDDEVDDDDITFADEDY